MAQRERPLADCISFQRNRQGTNGSGMPHTCPGAPPDTGRACPALGSVTTRNPWNTGGKVNLARNGCPRKPGFHRRGSRNLGSRAADACHGPQAWQAGNPHLDVEAHADTRERPAGAPGDAGRVKGHPRPARPTGGTGTASLTSGVAFFSMETALATSVSVIPSFCATSFLSIASFVARATKVFFPPRSKLANFPAAILISSRSMCRRRRFRAHHRGVIAPAAQRGKRNKGRKPAGRSNPHLLSTFVVKVCQAVIRNLFMISGSYAISVEVFPRCYVRISL